MESITEAVLKYQDTGEGYDALIERISLIIYNYPNRISSLSEEDKCDFYLSFYSRINGLINNFTYQGRAFEALLNQTLKWHSRSYLSKLKKEKHLMAVEVREEEIKIKDLFSEASEESEINRIEINLKSNASRKRLLYLVLMDTPNISDREMEQFSRMTGYDSDWLLALKDRINEMLHSRSGRLTILREKRNNYFSKLQYYQLLLSEELNPAKKAIYHDKINVLKKRLADTRRDISKVPVRPTHNEIAELLGVPKGTVDSGLHYFRKKVRDYHLENGYSLFS
ncbi:hypothetical protein [Spirochaeta isovalerica]|uniref:RNA polymerase sigma factor, sigma-70 family n=1 Tax=Spirochaeta isovalerica TaxID=150 RepID=A0A841RAW0_9SPIO|nr:hypothetical protein [Spirochaeta isovalerica]MBB6481063.1 hypothetical protein [Spirochaeta isovalerica]